jgi:hypothetical protein
MKRLTAFLLVLLAVLARTADLKDPAQACSISIPAPSRTATA